MKAKAADTKLIPNLARGLLAALDKYPPGPASVPEIDLGHRLGIVEALRLLYLASEDEDWSGPPEKLLEWARTIT